MLFSELECLQYSRGKWRQSKSGRNWNSLSSDENLPSASKKSV